jgi:hypothetical protein
MANHLVAALYFEDMAKQERRPEEHERLLVLARSFHWLAIAEDKRYTEDIPKRLAADSVRRAMKRKRA